MEDSNYWEVFKEPGFQIHVERRFDGTFHVYETRLVATNLTMQEANKYWRESVDEFMRGEYPIKRKSDEVD